MTTSRTNAIKELAELFIKKKASFFIGAGASLSAGLPTWRGLLGELIDELEKLPGVDGCDGFLESCRRMTKDSSKWFVAASVIRAKLGKRFDEYIDSRFCNENLKPGNVHKHIVDIPWNYVITTNYDDLIETAYSIKYSGNKRVDGPTYDKTSEAVGYFYKDKPFVFYCHGRARTEPSKLILSDSDYRTLVHSQIGYQSFLQTLFVSTSFLFVGSSINDPDITMLLQYLYSTFHGNTPRQYALIPDSEREAAEIEHYDKEYRIQMIALPHENYANEVDKFLLDLRAKIDELPKL